MHQLEIPGAVGETLETGVYPESSVEKSTGKRAQDLRPLTAGPTAAESIAGQRYPSSVIPALSRQKKAARVHSG